MSLRTRYPRRRYRRRCLRKISPERSASAFCMHSAWQLYDVNMPRCCSILPAGRTSRRKRIVQFGPPFLRMDDVQGERGRGRGRAPYTQPSAGQKRVKGPLRASLSTISSSSLTSARKLDDVSNYPTQKPPLRGIQHTRRRARPAAPSPPSERRAREGFLSARTCVR